MVANIYGFMVCDIRLLHYMYLQVPVQFEFINKLNDEKYCKPWLTIKPSKAVVNVKDQIEVELEVSQTKRCCRSRNFSNNFDMLVKYTCIMMYMFYKFDVSKIGEEVDHGENPQLELMHE